MSSFGCIANTIFGTLSGSVATISCSGSGTVIVSQAMGTNSDTRNIDGPSPSRKNVMAFLGRKSATLAPVLFTIGESAQDGSSRLFLLPCEPAAQIDQVHSSITNQITGSIRGVVSVDPCQSLACIYGAHEILIVELTNQLTVIRTLQCEFEIENISTSSWSQNNSDHHHNNADNSNDDDDNNNNNNNQNNANVTVVVTGKSAKQIAAVTFPAAAASENSNKAKLRLEVIEGLAVPDEFEQEQDSVVTHTLQSANKSSPGSFVWWACFSSGLVTACYVQASTKRAGLQSLSELQGIPELTQKQYLTSSLNICASQSTNNIALWSTNEPAITLCTTGTVAAPSSTSANNKQQQQQPLAFHRSSDFIRLDTPALATRAIRGGTYMMTVGVFPNTQLPWTHVEQLQNRFSAHDLLAAGNNNNNSSASSSSPLQLARALLSVDFGQLDNVVSQIEKFFTEVEEKLNNNSKNNTLSQSSLDELEAQLNQLRTCRTALVQREKIERGLAGQTENINCSRAREWDKRIHSAFLLLHVTRFFVSSAKKNSSLLNLNTLRSRRRDNSVSFLKAIEEELKIPQDLDEYSQWIQASWPARLVIEHAAEITGVFTCTELFNDPVAQFQKMVRTPILDSVDGSLEWMGFFALYFFGDSSEQSKKASDVFINALRLPSSIVALARMARIIDAGNDNNNNSAEKPISVEEASKMANDTSIPVRSLINTLFCGLCDEGALTAAYSMTSTMTVTSLLRGDGKNAFSREVALRLAFLCSQKKNDAVLGTLLDHVLSSSTNSASRSFDDKALGLYVMSAVASVCAKTDNIFLLEGKLTNDTEDQNCALAQLSSFGAEKLKIELLVQLQRHAEALEAAQKFQTSNQTEQHWIGIVSAHLRSIVPHDTGNNNSNNGGGIVLDGDAAVSSSLMMMNVLLNNTNISSSSSGGEGSSSLDADVVRPVPPAFYMPATRSSTTTNNNRNNQGQRCKVYMKKTGSECGCQVPCPYHSASSQHAVALN